jgi:hypothetical protein
MTRSTCAPLMPGGPVEATRRNEGGSVRSKPELNKRFVEVDATGVTENA